ncbi:XrtV sorting system accessory protein [uncultured Phenylobacterium sp.]|uniref:XrtV sorting system accessory protein n=1 Tax=uncultured Phenylobacterium sp. TaxID=349273 RepID=UPI0025DDBB6B|nr:XrtV sorting system accessory protein [uncultured Phenylobacterium sp.]
METVYDWITVAIFGGLVVLFLHRSVQPGEPQDTILHYLPPAVGCAVANWVGNPPQNQGLFSFLIVLGVLIYVLLVLKPFGFDFKFPKR